MTGLVNAQGLPLRKQALTQEVATPTSFGLRSPVAGYPGDGLNPVSLANLLRAADHGDPLRYFELAEQIEERDLHYVGVLGTRRRAVTQLDVTVEAASDDARDVAIADMVRDWLDRDELADEMFDMLDAVPKGVSFTEIIWDTSEGQWNPARLEWRTPRWFTFDRRDMTTPLLRGGESGNGEDTPLDVGKFIYHRVKAKSGIPVRGGLARLATWNWMFKAFTLRDWAIFAQTFGQPVRVGRYHPGASKEDKQMLFRAVANIAGDMAAIIPAGMNIEFIESKNVGSSSDLFERRADWGDRQMSKAVLGQTNTTDTQAGGLGSGQAQVHKAVADDIEASDAKGLAATLNRDFVRPWVVLEHGPQKRYPRIRIARAEPEDLERLARVLTHVVPLGVQIEESQVRDKLGFSEPAPRARILTSPMTAAQLAVREVQQQAVIGTPPARPALPAPSLQSQQGAPFPPIAIGDRLTEDAAPEMAAMLGQIEAMMDAAGDLPELRSMLSAAYPNLDTKALAAMIGLGLSAAHLAGVSDVEDESVDA